MPHRSHARWRPAYSAGNIGSRTKNNEDPIPRAFPRGVATGDSTDPQNRGRPYVDQAESADDEYGGVSRYVNPPGFPGLMGNQVDKNSWERTGGIREVKRRTGDKNGNIWAVSGQPFRGRRRNDEG